MAPVYWNTTRWLYSLDLSGYPPGKPGGPEGLAGRLVDLRQLQQRHERQLTEHAVLATIAFNEQDVVTPTLSIANQARISMSPDAGYSDLEIRILDRQEGDIPWN